MEEILKIINDISDHYKSGKIYDKQNLVKLFLDHSSFEKFMVFFISSHEKEVEVTDDYINDILKDYDIEKSEVEKIFNDIKKPKEPSFSKNKLIKKPSFTKVKDSQIENTPNETRPSYNIASDITKPSDKKVKKTLKEYWNSWNKTQKASYITVCLVLFIFFFQLFDSGGSSSNNSSGSSSSCREPDKSGSYMNKVLRRIENTGCRISGHYFGGTGSYHVQAICPGGRIGVSDIEVLVNECGEILRVLK